LDGAAGGGLAAADFNNNGKLDLLLNWAPNGDGGPSVAYNSGGGVFRQPFTAVDTSILSNGAAAATGDVNGDGYPDGITVGTGGGDVVYVLLNDGSGKLVLGSYILEPPGQTGARRVYLADLDGNLKPDVLVFPGDGPWYIYPNRGKAPYFDVNGGGTQITDPDGRPEDIVIADVNGDGFPDLLVADSARKGTVVYLNTSVVNQAGLTVTALLDKDAPNNDFTNTQLIG
jgi:hypothetical protein